MTARTLDSNLLRGSTHATAAPTAKHIPALDGLRGAAAYLVVFGHYANYSGLWSDIFERGTGQVGVMLFFALSGFLMGALYLQRKASNAQVMQFYGKRVARVFPLYLFLVGLSFLFSMAATEHIFYKVDASNIAQHLMFLQGEHVLWTIPVEVQFYLLFPLLWLGASHLKDQRWLFALVPIAVGLGFFIDDFGRSILGHVHYFILGIAASLVVRHAIPYANALFVVSLVALGLYLPGAPLVIQCEDTYDLWQDPFYMVLIPVLVATAAQSSIATKTLGCRPMSFIGKISYSVYLTHIPIIVAIQSYTSFGYESRKGFLIFMILLVGVSYLSYRLIEAPSRTWLSRRLRPKPS